MNNKLFKPQHLYGQILLYMYDRSDERFDFKALRNHFKVDAEYFDTVLGWLAVDDLIVKEVNPIAGTIYRISYTGFRFIRELEDSRASKNNAAKANVISIFAAVISLGALIVGAIALYKGTC